MKVFEYESSYDNCVYRIKAGQSAQENWDLIKSSAQNDIWFHVKDEPSCHVVLTLGERKKAPHKSVFIFCAVLCKKGSNVRFSKNVQIIYTDIKNVKIKKTDKPGTVTASNTKLIKI
jgi:predicted ribosome quality control (RQC) complex YloA/Tae2 family protein